MAFAGKAFAYATQVVEFKKSASKRFFSEISEEHTNDEPLKKKPAAIDAASSSATNAMHFAQMGSSSLSASQADEETFIKPPQL